MKKMKNLLLVALFTVCTFVIGGTMVEAAEATLNNVQVVCQSSELGKNGTTDCYVIGNLQNDTATGAGLHGLIAKTTVSNLDIVDYNPTFKNVSKEMIYNGESSKLVSDLGNGQTYTCSTTNGSPCYLFITNQTGNGLIAYGNSTKTAQDTSFTVLASFTVGVNENAPVNDCGQFCVDLSYTLTDSEYTTGVRVSQGGAVCDEITIKEGEVGTGNFVSYAVLAAGAFIAISAIALAKKHNKFYRV